MGKPFVLDSRPADLGIVRGDGGRFMRPPTPSPPQVRREAYERGVDVDEAIADNRAPEHPVPRGAPRNAADEIPWPEAGPFNDAGRSPMRLD